MTSSGNGSNEKPERRPMSERVPSPEYRERLRRELLEDPDLLREIEEFRDFLASRGAGRKLA